MSALARLYAFTQARERHPDTRTLNTLNSSLNAWIRYHSFLAIIRARYDSINLTSVEQSNLLCQRKQKDAEPARSVSRSLTPEELTQIQRLNALSQAVHVEIESFYVFANILLDRIASTFGYYFFGKPKWNHLKLTCKIPELCRQKSFTIVRNDILTLPGDLCAVIRAYRNKRIEHVEEPRLFLATTWGPDNKARIVPTLIYPKQPEDVPQDSTGDLDKFLTLIDRYIIEVLDFFDANANQSVLPIDPPAQ